MPILQKPCPLALGERFEKSLTLSVEAIRNGATLLGDSNPLHHDEQFAARSRFGTLIASGAHSAGILAAAAAEFSVAHATQTLGLEFQCQFKRPVRANEPLRLTWEVVATEPKPTHEAYIVTLIGALHDSSGQIAVAATMKGMLFTQEWR